MGGENSSDIAKHLLGRTLPVGVLSIKDGDCFDFLRLSKDSKIPVYLYLQVQNQRGAERESMAPSWLKYTNLERMRWIDDVLSDKLDSLPFRPEITIFMKCLCKQQFIQL